jgi:hypothetical protein
MADVHANRRAKLLVLVFTAVSALAVWALLGRNFRLPADEELLALAADHRPELEELTALLREDGGLQEVRVDSALPTPPGVIERERAGRYRELLLSIGVTSLARDPGGIELVAAGRRVGGRALFKGLARRDAPPPSPAASLDPLTGSLQPGQTAFREAGGGWWLFLSAR